MQSDCLQKYSLDEDAGFRTLASYRWRGRFDFVQARQRLLLH
jgi:hypothetical protein